MIVSPHRMKGVNRKHELFFAAAGFSGVTLELNSLENIASRIQWHPMWA